MLLRREFVFGLATSVLSAPSLVRLSRLMAFKPNSPLGSQAPGYGFVQRLYVETAPRMTRWPTTTGP